MTVPLIHPRLAAMHSQFFPSQARIQAKPSEPTLDAAGQELESWADVAVDDHAVRAPLSAIERQAAGYTATAQAWHVLLTGNYPEITTRHRLSMDGLIFDIDAVETDQTASLTRLRVSRTGA